MPIGRLAVPGLRFRDADAVAGDEGGAVGNRRLSQAIQGRRKEAGPRGGEMHNAVESQLWGKGNFRQDLQDGIRVGWFLEGADLSFEFQAASTEIQKEANFHRSPRCDGTPFLLIAQPAQEEDRLHR